MADEAGAALVTGAGRRIGRLIALDLARQGWAVAVHHHRSAEGAALVVREIESAGGRAVALRADLAVESEVGRLVPAATEALGPLTLLVNNASTFENDNLLASTRASWDLHIEPNLRAPVRLAQDFARLLPSDRSGNIVNMLDQRVWKLTPHFMSYTVAKAALWALTRIWALDLAPRIRVNGIGPGPTMRNERQSEAHFEAQWRAVPLQRPTDPEDVLSALRFILATPSVTGQMIAVDGGEHLGWAQAARGHVPRE